MQKFIAAKSIDVNGFYHRHPRMDAGWFRLLSLLRLLRLSSVLGEDCFYLIDRSLGGLSVPQMRDRVMAMPDG
jgi:hypothetical protein